MTTSCLDLRGRRDQGLRFDGAELGAHYLLEDELGVRLLDFHGDPSTPLRLLRPPGQGLLYLRRLPDGAERTVPRSDGVVELAELTVAPARVRERGAASHAFATLFTHAFDAAAVSRWSADQDRVEASLEAARSREEADARARRTERIVGWTAVGVAVGAAAGAVAAAVSAHRLYDAAPNGESQLDTVARNERIDLRNHLTLGFTVGAVVSGAVGTWLLLRPHHSTMTPALDLALSAGGGVAGARWSF